MTRRRKLAAGIAVALALAAGIGVAIALRPPSLKQKLEQVRDGMSYDEVVELMGEPDQAMGWGVSNSVCWWREKRGHAHVSFSGEGVCERRYTWNEPSDFLDRVLAWLGL
jgi:hypothetical protein